MNNASIKIIEQTFKLIDKEDTLKIFLLIPLVVKDKRYLWRVLNFNSDLVVLN
jgi:hypothetical protein